MILVLYTVIGPFYDAIRESRVRNTRSIVLKNSERGRVAQDRQELQASCHQAYRALFAPRHAKELIRIAEVIVVAEEGVATARGDTQKEAARRALKALRAAQCELIVKRDQATQQWGWELGFGLLFSGYWVA